MYMHAYIQIQMKKANHIDAPVFAEDLPPVAPPGLRVEPGDCSCRLAGGPEAMATWRRAEGSTQNRMPSSEGNFWQTG